MIHGLYILSGYQKMREKIQARLQNNILEKLFCLVQKTRICEARRDNKESQARLQNEKRYSLFEYFS